MLPGSTWCTGATCFVQVARSAPALESNIQEVTDMLTSSALCTVGHLARKASRAKSFSLTLVRSAPDSNASVGLSHECLEQRPRIIQRRPQSGPQWSHFAEADEVNVLLQTPGAEGVHNMMGGDCDDQPVCTTLGRYRPGGGFQPLRPGTAKWQCTARPAPCWVALRCLAGSCSSS